ncbi:hypothetical protein ACROYT_G036052 [Oculina patagonica]
MVKSCEVCQEVRKAPPSAPLYPWRWPTRVWQRVHIDFAEKDGNYFLGLIDRIEVAHLRSTTAQSTIDQIRLWFAAYGLLEEVVSDNGPQFISQDFTNYLKQNEVVPPYHPSSNGAAEGRTQRLNSEEAFDEADPEGLPALMAVPVSVPGIPSPSQRISVPETTLEQPAQTLNPVADLVPESPTRKVSNSSRASF